MADEIRLFNAMQPIARRVYEARRRSGDPLEVKALTDQTLREFERAVQLGPHALQVRERLEGWFRQLLAEG